MCDMACKSSTYRDAENDRLPMPSQVMLTRGQLHSFRGRGISTAHLRDDRDDGDQAAQLLHHLHVQGRHALAGDEQQDQIHTRVIALLQSRPPLSTLHMNCAHECLCAPG